MNTLHREDPVSQRLYTEVHETNLEKETAWGTLIKRRNGFHCRAAAFSAHCARGNVAGQRARILWGGEKSREGERCSREGCRASRQTDEHHVWRRASIAHEIVRLHIHPESMI